MLILLFILLIFIAILYYQHSGGNPQFKNLVHIAGAGGAGKTTLGERLRKAGHNVVELDDYIGKTIKYKDNTIYVGLWFGDPKLNPRNFATKNIILILSPPRIIAG